MPAKNLESIDHEILALLDRRAQLIRQFVAGRKGVLSVAEISRLTPPQAETPSRLSYFIPPRRLFGLHLDPELVPRVGYLGPPHTYSHRAAVEAFAGVLHAIPQPTMRDAFLSVERGDCHFSVLPVQNSTDGLIDTTLDLLLENHAQRIVQLYVTGEFCLPIRHCLLSRAHKVESIKTVVSRDTALRQCAKWLNSHCPQAQLKNVESTTLGAAIAAQDPAVAAVADIELEKLFGLPLLARDIGDEPHNETQFVLIGKDLPGASGDDKTMFAMRGDSISLRNILRFLLDSNLQIRSVHPRPLRIKAFAQNFVFEVGCHYQDSAFRQFQTSLGRAVEDFHILGSWAAPRRADEGVQR